MITIHHEKETDFKKNGYGSLGEYVFNEGGNWELNGEFKIEFELPAISPFTNYIKERNIIQAPVPFMDRQLFRIYRTNKSLKSIHVEARHLFYDLIDNWIEDTNIVGKAGSGAIQQLLNNTQYPHSFSGSSNISSIANARMVRMNPVEALLDDGKDNTFISRWGGELVRNNHHIEMLDRIGVDRGVRIEHRKDLLGYNATIDISTVVTKIQPVGFDGLMLPERYVDSPKMDPEHPIIAEIKYSDIKAAIGEYEDDEDAVPLEEAYELLRKAAKDEFEINHVDEPETVIDVDFVALHNTEEYKDLAKLQEIRGGDTVHVNVPDHGFNITSRLVAFDFSLLQENHYTSTTLGNHVYEFTSGNTQINDLRKEIDESNERINVVQTAANGKNTIFRGPDDPTTYTKTILEGDLWYKPVANGEMEMYQWNGNKWELVVTTGVNQEITNKINDAKQAAEDAQTDATSAIDRVQEAIDNATEAYEYADSAIQAANSKNTVYRGTEKPLDGEKNDIWYKTVFNDVGDETGVEMYIHDGAGFVLKSYSAGSLGGTLDLSTLNVINLNMDSATGGNLHLDRGLKVTNNDVDVLKAENGNVEMNVDNLLIASQTVDKIAQTQFYQDGKAAGLLYEESGEIKSIISIGPNGPYIKGNNIVLDGDTIVDGTFTITDTLFADNMSISKFTTGTLNAANVNVINMNVSKLVGDITDFIKSNWNAIASSTAIDGTGIKVTHSDGSYTKLESGGLKRYVAGTGQMYHYLLHIVNFIYGESSANQAYWVQLPNSFKGKQFKVYFGISDSMQAPSYKYSIQRFVCTKHPDFSIDYTNARVPIIAYKSNTLMDGQAPALNDVQGIMFAIY